MPKGSKKGKGAQPSNGTSVFDEDALARLTSKLDKTLGANDHKRKKPPTNGSNRQKSKRQRGPEAKPPREGSRDKQDDQAGLMAEIRALGGDEQDLELINQVDSDEEGYAEKSPNPADKKLKKELASLSKELGFAGLKPEDATDEGEEGEGDEGDGEEDEEAGGDSSLAEADKRSAANRRPGGMVNAAPR